MKLFSVNFINKTIRILLLFLFLINVGASFYMPLLAVYVTGHILNATLTTVGIAVAICAIVKSVLQINIASWLDSQAGEKSDFFILLFGSILAIIYTFSFLFISEVWHLYVLQILTGIGDACLMASYYAIFSHHIDKNSQGFEWSLLSVGGLTISAAIGGALGGFVADNYGFRTVFILAGILNAVAAFFLITLYPYVKVFRTSEHYKTIVHERRIKGQKLI